jgi:hypothetical protein
MVRDPNTKTVAGHHPDELADCHRAAETAIPAAPAWPLATDSVPAAESHQAGDDADKARSEMAALPGRLEATGSAPTPQNEGRPELPATASTDSAEVLPVVIPVEAEQKLAWWQRISLILIALLIGTVLGIARSLNPYDENGQPRRWGTHQQLGLPPCSFQRLTGWPCPSCGLTTSFSLLMHGDWRAALAVNPAGPVMVLLAVTMAGWFALAGISGRTLGLPDWHWLSSLAAWTMLWLVLGCWLIRALLYLRNGSW